MTKINVKILISNDFHNPQCINFLIIPSKNKIRKKKLKSVISSTKQRIETDGIILKIYKIPAR